jgi:DNA-damage-inducible protein D
MAGTGGTGTSGASVASVFEAIRRLDSEGGEYWSARDLAKALTYTEWRNFKETIQAAMIACETSGHAASDHFVEANKMIPLGKGA